MKIHHLLFAFIFLIQSCNTNYSGYIYDIDTKKPIKGVKVCSLQDDKLTQTDEKGFFTLKEETLIGNDIILKKDNYRIDTLPVYSTHNGEFISRNFTGDTIYLISHKSKYIKYFQ
ncbi:hypothetical protein CSC81_13025 [Tenacibaculum discolor]|uniref:Carboxypeptidase regulatory-like domain-containing protein n=1 Tax=Tenacibaculum discolor TaxID=361581 RepID=A0A2G1BST3_9FLAO|nr:hypothetical protein [Tenacibaculum discolor]MDP2542141.1 hypothetical protein [Tenacibaculum discolor]PHN96645.1 hypothetical protein CSC81_13025 [Tenacibaculum discolor]